jgi:CDGSH-type Zn-finger protein
LFAVKTVESTLDQARGSQAVFAFAALGKVRVWQKNVRIDRDGGGGDSMVDPIQIVVKPTGPLLVKGPITLVDPDGQEIATEDSTTALCRCGGSASKPFCDGTHKKIGFNTTDDPAERARQEAERLKQAS